jgi:hypothetical protein
MGSAKRPDSTAPPGTGILSPSFQIVPRQAKVSDNGVSRDVSVRGPRRTTTKTPREGIAALADRV